MSTILNAYTLRCGDFDIVHIVAIPDRLEQRVAEPEDEDVLHRFFAQVTTVRLKVEENQLVDVFGEIGTHVEGLKGA